MFTIQKILSGGDGKGGGFGCPENFVIFSRGQCGPGLPFEARGPISSRGCQ